MDSTLDQMDKCQKCDKSVEPGLHYCPYYADINNDDGEEHCNCCEDCMEEYAGDI